MNNSFEEYYYQAIIKPEKDKQYQQRMNRLSYIFGGIGIVCIVIKLIEYIIL